MIACASFSETDFLGSASEGIYSTAGLRTKQRFLSPPEISSHNTGDSADGTDDSASQTGPCLPSRQHRMLSLSRPSAADF